MKYLYEDRCLKGNVHNDMVGHMHTLCVLAAMSREVAEFGVRTGNSTVALMYGLQQAGGGVLHSYDIAQPDLGFNPAEEAPHVRWNFTEANTATIDAIPMVDLLFIDTLHTYDQIKAELRQARRVRKWIAMHDTEFNRIQGENGQLGIWPAIQEFLNDNREVWTQLCQFRHSNGLTILSRIKQ